MPADWVREAAERLAVALAAREIPRGARPGARRALTRAFEALERAEADDLVLRALEAHLPGPPAWSPAWPLLEGLPRPPPVRPTLVSRGVRGALRSWLVARCAAHLDMFERIEAAQRRVLDTFRTQATPDRRGESRESRLAEEPLDLTLPDG